MTFIVARKGLRKLKFAKHISVTQRYIYMGFLIKAPERAKVEYDKEKGLVRITQDNNGYKVYKHIVSVRIPMPQGKYAPIGNNVYKLVK